MSRVAYEKAYDTNGNPVTGVYVPNVGEVPLQGAGVTTDGTTGKTPSAGMTAVIMDKAGVNQCAVDAQGAQLVTLGGKSYQNCAAAAAQLVKTGAGRLCRIIVLATGTAAVTIYDNTAASGQPVFIVPASAATGSSYDAQVPCGTGIFVGGVASSPQLLVTFN